MKRLKGFTLVELVITIAIVIILSVVSVPIYNGYTRKAKMSEGYALLGMILSAQKAYFSEYGNFLQDYMSVIGGDNNFVAADTVFNIDARGNKYFTAFNICPTDAFAGYGINPCVIIPPDLRTGGNSILKLVYNVTSGSTFLETNDWHY